MNRPFEHPIDLSGPSIIAPGEISRQVALSPEVLVLRKTSL